MEILNHATKPKRVSRLNFFSRLEVAELPKLLMPEEQVLAVLSGFYTAGTAILCVTSRRLLLIDKKLIRLNFEDIRFESISEVNYSHQIILGSLKLYYGGRSLHFKTWYKHELRILAQFVQNKIFEARGSNKSSAMVYPVGDSVQSDLISNSEPIQQSSGIDLSQMSKYFSNNASKWKRTRSLVGAIESAKLGRQILNLEVTKR